MVDTSTLLKALSLECLTNYIVQDTLHNEVIFEKINELNDEFAEADSVARTSLLAKVYPLVLGLEVI